MKKDGIALSSIISSIIAVLLIVYMASQGQGGFLTYFFAIVAYIAIFIVSAYIFRNTEINLTKYIYYALILGAMAAGANFVVKAKANSGSASDIWVNYPNAINLIALLLIIAFSFSVLLKLDAKINLWPFYVLISIIYGYNRYAPNLLLEDYFDIDAYAYSIYNVYYNKPYIWATRGNYGHYGLFFKLPMMIFGAEYVKLAAMIGILGGLIMLCYCFAVDRLINNAYLKILVVLSCIADALYMNTASYYQSAPHRYVFIMIMMAWIAHCYTKPGKRDAIIGFIISSLAVLWNLESGVAVICAWCVYQILCNCQKNGKLFNLNLLKYIAAIPAEVFTAIIIVNIYNLCCGGTIDVKTFFYPVWTDTSTAINSTAEVGGIVAASNVASKVLITTKSVIVAATGITGTDSFALPLKIGNYSYIYFVPLLLSAFCVPFAKAMMSKLEKSVGMVVAPIATMGIVMYSYYMNRFYILNAWITVPEIAFIAGIIVDVELPDIKKFLCSKQLRNSIYYDLKTTVAIVLVMGLSMIGFVGVCGIQQQSYVNMYTSKQDTTDIQNCVEAIRQVVPENTYAVGVGTAELYSMLGWDTRNHWMDFPDCGGVELEELYQIIYGKDEVFLNQEVTYVFTGGSDVEFYEAGNFETVETFELGNQTYVYLRKNQ